MTPMALAVAGAAAAAATVALAGRVEVLPLNTEEVCLFPAYYRKTYGR